MSGPVPHGILRATVRWRFDPGDRVIISASAIPGNEKTISRVINELYRKGAEVIYDKLADLHVSGHACQEELKIMHALTEAEVLHPGSRRAAAPAAACRAGPGRWAWIPKNIIIADIGKVIELTPEVMQASPAPCPAGKILVDGLGVGDVGSVVLRDRKHLAQDGMIVVVRQPVERGRLRHLRPGHHQPRLCLCEGERGPHGAAMKMIATAFCWRYCHNRNITDWATIKSSDQGRPESASCSRTRSATP